MERGTGIFRILSVLVLVFAFPLFAGSEDLYRSNQIGMRFEEIRPAERSGHPWVLSRTVSGNRETLTLFHEGKEEKRWERQYASAGRLGEETFSEGDVLQTVQRFDGLGRVAEEETYEQGELQEIRENRYVRGELDSVTVRGPDGALLFTDRYIRTRDRKLREVRREYPDGSSRVSAFSFSDDRLLQEQHLREQEGVLLRYDGSGRLAFREEWDAERLVRLERFTYDGDRLVSSTVTVPGSARREEFAYNEAGRIVSERVLTGSVIARETRYLYEEDLLVERQVESRGVTETWRYEYDGDGEQRRETYLKNGVREKVVVRTGEDERSEELYLAGELFLRAYYRGNEKIREEFIRNGEVIRVRETGGTGWDRWDRCRRQGRYGRRKPMNIRWVFFVASRNFRTRRREKGHASSLLSVAGIAVGVMTLITVLGVMNGFQIGYIEDILEVSSYHLRLRASEALQPESIRELQSLPGVRALVPFSDVQTLAVGSYSDPRACMVRGIPQESFEHDRGLREHLEIVRGSFDVEQPGTIVIGSELSRFLGVQVGQRISLLALPHAAGSGGLRPEGVEYLVTGVFRTGYYLFDLTWSFVSIDDPVMFPAGTERVWGMKLDDRFRDRQMLSRLQSLPEAGGIEAVSWREYNRAFFGALRMEKIMLLLLVGLIFIVVAVNIFHSLRRTVYEKREEIGILRAVGAGSHGIRAIFVSEGLLIGFVGGVVGVILGLLLASHINEVFLLAERIANGVLFLAGLLLRPLFPGGTGESFSLFSPTYFYLTEVPSRVLFPEVLLVYLFAQLSTAAAAFFASLRISGISPAGVLREE